ncbi:MAG: hypothetical protein AMXMBFR58_03180 [Phycisphaerae bacterium]|nr:hypothetical protein [Phycisphaerales bacterium]
MHTQIASLSAGAVLGVSAAPVTSPLIPTWIAATAAVITLLALALHMALLARTPMPASRRRIRTVNGWLMLGAIPVLMYAFGFAVPSQARSFALAWAASIGLIGIIVLLAILDILNNWRLHRRASAQLRRELAEMRRQRASAIGAAPNQPPVQP